MTTKYQPNAANQYAKIAHGTEVVEPEYDPQGNCPSLCSRPAKWLRIDDTALAVEQLLHDATRKLTQAPPSEPSGYAQRGALSVSRLTSVARLSWDADIHLMSVTTQGSPQSSPHSPSEEPGTAGASARGATGSVASRQASGLPHIAPHNAIDEAPSRTTTTRFVYDALHRRVGRVKDDGEVTVFVYEGWNVIAEKTVCRALTGGGENMKIETRYTWGEDLSGTLQGAGGIGGLLRSTIVEASTNGTRSRAERDSQSQAAHEGGERRGAARSNTAHEHTFSYDSNGNVILLTDGLGRETGRYAYDAFGKTLTATGPAAKLNRYRFSTKPVEEGSGLCYYGYRYYDPVTGRWPSRDPIGELGGVNVYVSMNNEAVNHNDLLGQVICGSLIELGMRLYRAIAQCNSCSLELNCTHCCSLRRDLDIIVASGGLLCDGVESLYAGAASRGVFGVIDGVLSWD